MGETVGEIIQLWQRNIQEYRTLLGAGSTIGLCALAARCKSDFHNRHDQLLFATIIRNPEASTPMLFPQLFRLADLSLLLLRFMVGIIFLASGWNHLKDPEGRSKSIGMSKSFIRFLGAA